MRLFTSLGSTKQALRAWKEHYNTVRQHSAIGNRPPAIHAAISTSVMQRAEATALTEGAPPRCPTTHNGLK
ncbi:MAG: hypothetical protein E6Q98_08590 [Rhodospirillaceae bacterium]|nr:MAG: hypothetical protein E6Q98_08590 [Rhodospirillaceae bacterium]